MFSAYIAREEERKKEKKKKGSSHTIVSAICVGSTHCRHMPSITENEYYGVSWYISICRRLWWYNEHVCMLLFVHSLIASGGSHPTFWAMVELLTPSTKKVIRKKLRTGSLSKLHFLAGSTLNLLILKLIKLNKCTHWYYAYVVRTISFVEYLYR